MDPIVGSDLILQGTFRDVDNALANPADVTLTVRDPDGTFTSYTGAELDNPSVGIFQRSISFDTAGIWRWRWEGETNDVSAIDEGIICIQTSAFVGAEA